ncbi:MAG: beta-ketoacyl-[acyl-carrier-protein] synthase family protein [Candidatus Magnetomorum sp.]|nr:beta-ketoacyl-[acyl-carrier-protein] synthase family protein [Candidatus Magnetomorum sp.]
MKNRVVITGMGVYAPNAVNIQDFKTALREGRSGIHYVPQLEEMKFGCRIAGIPKMLTDSQINILKKAQLPVTSDTIRYAVVTAIEAWKDAGLDINANKDEADWNTGAMLGCGVSDMKTIAEILIPMVNQGKARRMGSQIVEQVMGSGVSASIGGVLGLGNQVTSNSSACNTGSEAIVESTWRIRSGRAKRMIAGGVEGSSPYIWAGFDSMRVLATKFNDRPEEGSRPMSASAGGFVPGSGAGLLILEDLETALKRGARIYAEIVGAQTNCGGQRGGGSMTAPNPQGVQRCIREAIIDAGISSGDIDAINGHLTATFADPYEIKNWSEALNKGPDQFPYINSTKSMIGHCLGATGAIEIIASVLEMDGNFLHPSLNCEDIHPDIESFADKVVRTLKDDIDINIIAKASFGFGDVNSCLILKKWNIV